MPIEVELSQVGGLLLTVVKGECFLAEVILADAVKSEFLIAKAKGM